MPTVDAQARADLARLTQRVDALSSLCGRLSHALDRVAQLEGADAGGLGKRLSDAEGRLSWLEAQSEGVEPLDNEPTPVAAAPRKPRRKGAA